MISVIMSVYNGEKYLAEAVESILEQTESDLEFLIVDDASTDRTYKILKTYQKKDNRIKLFLNKENQGLTKNLNFLIKKANGEYIARMDADDISHKDRLMMEKEFLSNNEEYGFVGTNFLIIDRDWQVTKESNYPTVYKTIKKKIMFFNLFCHGSIMIKTSVIRSVDGYREFFRYSQDYDLWLRLLTTHKGRNLSQKLFFLRKWSDNVSSRQPMKQLQLSSLASAFAFERKKTGKDSIGFFEKTGIEEGLKSYPFKKYYYLALSVKYYYLRDKVQARSTAKKSIKSGCLHWRNFRSLFWV